MTPPPPDPAVGDEIEPYRQALAQARLVLRRCSQCRACTWYPRLICGSCRSTRGEWVEASGVGSVYSFTTVRHADHPVLGSRPYIVSYVELDEGPRLLTNLVGVDPDAVKIGMRVRADFVRVEDGWTLLQFRPD